MMMPVWLVGRKQGITSGKEEHHGSELHWPQPDLQSTVVVSAAFPFRGSTKIRLFVTVRYAVEQGVDFIDTSRAYTTSEGRIREGFEADR